MLANSSNKELQNPQLRADFVIYESVLNTLSDGIVIADKSGVFLYWNPRAVEIVGLGHSDAKPDEWSSHYGCFYPDKITPYPSNELPLVKALNGEEAQDVELFIRNPKNEDGTLINVNGKPILGNDGDIKGGVVTFKEIFVSEQNERVKQEKEIKDIDKLSDIYKSEIMSTLLDFIPLNKSEPKIFMGITSKYTSILELSLIANDYNWHDLITDEIRSFAKQLGHLKAGPADVLDIHKTVLRKRKDKLFNESSKRVLLELMSSLASYYRNNSVNKREMVTSFRTEI